MKLSTNMMVALFLRIAVFVKFYSFSSFLELRIDQRKLYQMIHLRNEIDVLKLVLLHIFVRQRAVMHNSVLRKASNYTSSYGLLKLSLDVLINK